MTGRAHRVASALAAAGALLAQRPPALAATGACAVSDVPRATLAVVIGANAGPPKERLVELKYADDDAVRYYRLIKMMRPNAHAVLLTRPGADIWERFPESVGWRNDGRIRAPTLANLHTTLDELRQKAQTLHDLHVKVDLYFVFAGHGGVLDDGGGGLYLEDGVLSREELYKKVIAQFPDVDKHLIIDACHAELAVSSRSGNEHIERMRDLEDIHRQEDAGVVAAANPTGRVKEWERYRGGIFSHEVLSGLLGGADVDGDDCITYRELVGFLRAANDGIHVDAAKIDVMSAPPHGDKDFVIADWRNTQEPRLRVPPSVTGHIWIEDQNLERWAETNRPSGQALRLVVPSGSLHYLRVEPPRTPAEAPPAAAPPICFQAKDPGQDAAVASCEGGQDREDEREPNVGSILKTGLFQTAFGPPVLAGLGSPPWLPEGYPRESSAEQESHGGRLWLWVAIGAVVAAGVVGTYLATRPLGCPGGADCR